MLNVAVVTDSIACLARELVEQYRIGIVPIRLLVQGKVYRDWVDITPSQAYELFLQDPEAFTTSATILAIVLGVLVVIKFWPTARAAWARNKNTRQFIFDDGLQHKRSKGGG